MSYFSSTEARLPAALPAPSQGGYGIEWLEAAESVEMDDGHTRRRPKYRSAPRKVTLAWVLSQAQFDVFYAFWHTTLRGGARPFAIALHGLGAPGARWTHAQFAAPYKAAVVEHGRYSVTAEVMALQSIEHFDALPLGAPVAANPGQRVYVDLSPAQTPQQNPLTSISSLTRFTGNAAGAVDVAGGVLTVTHSGERWDTLLDAYTFAASDSSLYVAADVVSHAGAASGYDVVGVGPHVDAQNFILAVYNEIGGACWIQIKRNGVDNYLGSASIARPSSIALSLVGNTATMYTKSAPAAPWTALISTPTNIAYDFVATPTLLATMRPGVTVATGANSKTWQLSRLRWDPAVGTPR